MIKASGRPRLREGETARQVRVTVTQEDAAYLADIGGGNRSHGVRECIKWHFLTHGAALRERCKRDGVDLEETVSQLIWGYVTMPTPDEVREALERGPQDDSASPAS